MSNLAKAIYQIGTPKRTVTTNNLFTEVFDGTQDFIQQKDHFIYLIEAKFATQFIAFNDQKDIGFKTEECKKLIIQAVFGEFVENFFLIRKALYQQDFDKALQELAKFEKKMFNTEEEK